MPIYARFLPMSAQAHRVAVLCLERVVAFDLSVPGAGLLARLDRRSPAVRAHRLCGPARQRRRRPPASRSPASPGSRRWRPPTRCSSPVPRGLRPARRSRRSRRCGGAAAGGARIASICTGAFALAHAGLLDGRRATTHWFSAGEMAARFPRVEVDPNALYVEDGPVVTSAGLAAGIDLCLHLVRSDHGERIGSRVARAMVAAPHRAGGQAQFIERALPEANGARLARGRAAVGARPPR